MQEAISAPVLVPTQHDETAENVNRLLGEGAIPMAAASRVIGESFKGNRRTHPSTLMRWIVKGILLPNGDRLKLEGFRLNGRYMTSRAAVVRFIAAQQPATGHQIDSGSQGGETQATKAGGKPRGGQKLSQKLSKAALAATAANDVIFGPRKSA
jgi:hypothetical protein